MDEFIFIGLSLLSIPALGIAGFVLALSGRRRIRELEARVAELEAADSRAAVATIAPVVIPSAPAPAPEPPRATEPSRPSPIPAVAAAPARRPGLEERVAARWAVWLGSGALALAAVFLVRYSIEQGLLGPTARVILGLAFGAALLGASEWLRRLGSGAATAGIAARLGVPPANLPPAVAAAGVVALFAATYAAFALYGLILPLTAFVALAAISALAMALALLHGPVVAVLGQAAAFAVPALIGSREPFAPGLFGYVLAVAGGCLALARYRNWRWMAWIALAGAVSWTLIWWADAWRPGDSPPLAIFLVALAALFVLLGPAPLDAPRRWRVATADLVPDAPLAIVLLLGFGLARIAGYDFWSLAAMLALAAGLALDARRRPALEAVAALAAAIVAAALAAWRLPDILAATFSGDVGFPGAVLTPTAARFLIATIIAGALFAGLGGALLWGATRPGFWAGLGVAMPFALLALAYWRLEDFAAAPSWSIAALALAGASLGMAAWVARFRATPGIAAALGVYAVGVTAGVSLAMAATLRLGGLSVALALQIPVLAHLALRLDVPMLRKAAAAVGVVVLARLVLNPWIVGYPLGETPIFNALLWMYGVPMLAFGLASRHPATDDAIARFFEAGALVFAVALVTLQIRHAMGGGRLDGRDGGLTELGLYATVWLGAAWLLHVVDGVDPSPVRRWAWRILAGAGGLAALAAVTVANPALGGGAVGRWPVVNALALAYLLPAAFAAGFAWSAQRRGQNRLAAVAGVGALALGFAWLTLEVARAFRPGGNFGSLLSRWSVGEGESYAYSAAWLVYGGALLAGGLRLASPALRWASLAVVGLTVAKVFLIDMAALTGLWRVASFFGLGLALLALGWLYQRYVLPRRA